MSRPRPQLVPVPTKPRSRTAVSPLVHFDMHLDRALHAAFRAITASPTPKDTLEQLAARMETPTPRLAQKMLDLAQGPQYATLRAQLFGLRAHTNQTTARKP